MSQFLIWFFLLSVGLTTQAQHLTSMGAIKKIGVERTIHRFFDTSPISPSGKYIALFRLPYENKSPQPGDKGEVVVIELKSGKEIRIESTFGWEVQLGANVQWGKSDKDLFYNDVDTATWEAYVMHLNPFSGEKRRMEGTVFMVSPDGKKLASYNLKNSRFAQAGYGVVVPNEHAIKNLGLVEADGIFITDVKTGKCAKIASIQDIYDQTVPTIKIANPQDYEYYCFQVKWNPQGTSLLTTIQWTHISGGERKRAVITMLPDGSNIKTAITNEQWSKGGHHVNWMPDGEHLSMNLNVDGKPGIEIVQVKYDGSEMKTVYPTGSGHPSFHPKGLPYVITDAYSGEMPLNNGKTPIRLINISSQTEKIIAEVDLPEIKKFEFRVDAHPAWDRSGRYVVFNGTDQGSRCVFIADLKNVINAQSSSKLRNAKE